MCMFIGKSRECYECSMNNHRYNLCICYLVQACNSHDFLVDIHTTCLCDCSLTNQVNNMNVMYQVVNID
jgi:hypothetical protein